MTLIYGYQGRGLTRDVTIQDSAGATIAPGANDKVRATIYREGEPAAFTVTSGTNTANGSSFTKGATNRLRIDAADMTLIDPGCYTLFIDYWDNADANWKPVSKQVMVVEGTNDG